MIVCVAANPSIDKHFAVERIVAGAIHRPRAFLAVPGGKGLNVARAIGHLGRTCRAVALVGGHAGRWVVDAARHEGVEVVPVWREGETRSSLSVAAEDRGDLTEFYEDGAAIEPEDWARLEAAVREAAGPGDWVAISGSLPPGAPPEGYAGLVRAAADHGARVAVDAAGPALRHALAAGPDLVKVNVEEAVAVVGGAADGEEAALAAARALRAAAAGGTAAAVTRGAEGAVLAAPDGAELRGRVAARGAYPVGSGDCFLGGMLAALEAGEGWAGTLALALATATANAEQPGAGVLDPARVRELVGAVEVAA